MIITVKKQNEMNLCGFSFIFYLHFNTEFLEIFRKDRLGVTLRRMSGMIKNKEKRIILNFIRYLEFI